MKAGAWLVVLFGANMLLLGACSGLPAAESPTPDRQADEAQAESSEDPNQQARLNLPPSGYTCEDGSDPFAGVTLRFAFSLWPNTDFCQRTIAYEEVLGLLRPDQISPIDDPQFETVAEVGDRIADPEPVIVFIEDGDARAYPLAIMTWHEIANDTVGERPVAVTYCPLCNAAIVFDRVVDGQELTFGTTGNLRNSDLIMWDRQTQSWWQQFTGQGIVGQYTGTQLDFLPAQVTSWAEFKAAFPDGQALRPAAIRDYGRNPYVGYDTNPSPFAFAGEIDDRLFPVERVLGLLLGGEAIAYPFEALSEAGVVNDALGGEDVVVFFQPGQVSALDGVSIANSREVGSAAAYSPVVDGEKLVFSYDAGAITDDQTVSLWNVFGQAVEGPLAGAQLQPLAAYPHFWFAWAAFRPDTAIWQAP